METKDTSLKQVYFNILDLYNHFTHNSRSTPLSVDISKTGDTIISIYEFIYGKSDLKYNEWLFINPNICVMVMNTKINNISIIIRTTKSAPDKIECKFKCNSNSITIQYKNKSTDYVNKRFHVRAKTEFTYGLKDYIRDHISDEVKCWLLLSNNIKGVI